MKKTELFERVSSSHERLARALEGLTEEEAGRAGLNPQWSIKDALAHIVAWEQAGAQAIEGILDGTYKPQRFDAETIDRFNAEAVERRRTHSLAQLNEEFDAAHRRMTEVLGRLPDEVDEKSPAYKFAEGVTFRHMTHHAAQIEEWRKQLR